MNSQTRSSRRSWAWLAVLVLIASAAHAQQDDDGSWYPRSITSERGSAVIHAPQVESWTDFAVLSARVAFEIRRADSDEQWVGALNFSAQTDTNLAVREVLLHDIEVESLNIDGLTPDADEYLLIRDAFTSLSRRVPLDLVLAYLPKDTAPAGSAGLSAEPPQIFVSTEPAILFFVDGDPRILPIEGTDLTFVLNTPWDVVREGDGGDLFLCHGSDWLTATDFDADWRWATALSEELSRLPDTDNWDRVRSCLPASLSNPKVPDTEPPSVFYTNSAAELLLFDGDPAWTAIGDEGLSYASNTEQELFQVGEQNYLLLSGRWFSSDSLEGPWSLQSSLPDAFQSIPPADGDDAHEKSYVRASVPGTEEAWEAALVASIPRTAEIQRGTESDLALDVTYAGEPRFAPIEDTGIELAVNTSFQVLRYGGTYYLCHNATWLTSSSATGPWVFADSIPPVFKDIPPTSPAYNTTFVDVEGEDLESIFYSYTSGYEEAYVTEENTVVYGTGYDYGGFFVSMALFYGFYDGYPYPPYYWWPPTYGYGSWYNPGTGRYGEAIVGYGPYGAAGGAAVFNPETGVYGRGQAVWDNDEFAGRGFAYNPNTDTSLSRNRYIDFEDNEGWSQRVARRGDEWRYTESEWEDGRMVTEFESSRGTEGTVVRERDGDTITSDGEISRGDRSATFETTREREGDAIVSEGSITGENRSATFDSVIEDGQLSGNIQGSEGGSGTVDRQLNDGEITGGGTFTRNGNTIETDVTRDADGVTWEFETSGGGQGVSRRSGDDGGFVYESGSGDKYAGRDGNVYQKTDSGWSKVENPGTANAQSGFGNRQAATSRADNLAGLERDYQSRQRGFDRYGSHRASGGRMSRGRGGMMRRGRR